MQKELWCYSAELDISFVINNDTGTITPVTLTAQEREQIFQQHEQEAEKERYEREQWEATRREYYDECYRDEPDHYFREEEG